jgi:hypothetical protein
MPKGLENLMKNLMDLKNQTGNEEIGGEFPPNVYKGSLRSGYKRRYSG